MAEPSTTTFSVAAAIGVAGLMPGIDGNALLGAFTGAALVVVTSKDVSILQRFAYLLISITVGYQSAPEVIQATPIHSTGVAAFFASALAITFTLQLIERIKSFDLLSLFRK
ncbi:phage holin family protein [Burkholderia sp. FERM BP-3421]|jgi:hypothetical protein|uniref:putative holin n=1 Tax=Burkholderia sp. FERM BP-3421 TaxID=1494466 RepID=UPI002094B626|nr:putative holin [Burkholderia sp. FERM BP-3421]WDD95940.1 phage holin family protein [Burkholderia sp. FERM BP-3421]